jgi:hypothetical protein
MLKQKATHFWLMIRVLDPVSAKTCQYLIFFGNSKIEEKRQIRHGPLAKLFSTSTSLEILSSDPALRERRRGSSQGGY